MLRTNKLIRTIAGPIDSIKSNFVVYYYNFLSFFSWLNMISLRGMDCTMKGSIDRARYVDSFWCSNSDQFDVPFKLELTK